MSGLTKEKIIFVTCLAWILAVVTDYYLQFFHSRFWNEQAMQFLRRILK